MNRVQRDRGRRSAIVVGVAVLLGALSARAQSPSMVVAHATVLGGPALASGTNVDALRSHEVVIASLESEGTSVHTGYAAVIVQRPLADVVAAIHDVDHYRDFIPQFEQSHELSRTSTNQDWFVRIAIHPIASLWARLRYHQVALANGAVEIDGHAVQGNVERMDVRWRATPVDDGAATVLEFWSLVLPSFPVPLPNAVLDHEQESAARRGVEAVRLRVEAPASPPHTG
jgi:ribosome-associated toxin RatA of RatAB toxin-antitoxin module